MDVTPMTTAAPRAILSNLLVELLGHMPGVRDGDVESVHEARVATRRLREVVPLMTRAHPERVRAVKAVFRRAGRRLGRVRELDVMSEHLGRLEERVPDAAVAVALAKRAVAERQASARRKLIKSLERLRLGRFADGAHLSPGPFARLRHPARAFSDWRAPLSDRIVAGARNLAAAVEHGGGVYFPNRLHAIRIAVKKLRYSVELAERTGLWRPPRLLRDLRRIQATLGALHDAQVLLDRLDEFVPRDAAGKADFASLASALRVEIDSYHREYLQKRDRVRAICEACVRAMEHGASRAWVPPTALVAVSAAVVPAGLFLIAERRSPEALPPTGGQVVGPASAHPVRCGALRAG